MTEASDWLQVHTTGMDIKQAPNAAAVVTIGKVSGYSRLHRVHSPRLLSMRLNPDGP